jgi:hypothetical protein
MRGSLLVPLMMFGWLPLTLLLYAMFSPRRAFLIAAIGGWLFLPVASAPVPGFVDYSKDAIVSFAPLLGMLIFDADRLRNMKPSLVDLPMLVWCLCPMLTSIFNDLGPYDGLAGLLDRLAWYYLPYALGRAYFGTYAGLRELLQALFIGVLVYAPLCVWEARMSPQLHIQVYGFFAHESGFAQVFRFGGWRPMVFMHHGLMLGLFMALGTLAGMTLWWSGHLKRFLGLPMPVLLIGLLLVNVYIKSTGALALLIGGALALFSISRLRLNWAYLALALVPLAYASVRAPGLWDGSNVVKLVAENIGEDRAESLSYRLEAESLLAGKAMQQPIYGWGMHDRGRVAWAKGPDGRVVADGLWIQAFNVNGLIGLSGLLGLFLVPILWVFSKLRPLDCLRSGRGVLVGAGLICSLYMIDNLLNAMIAPMYFTLLGGLTAYCINNPGHFRIPLPPRRMHAAQAAWLNDRRGVIEPTR